MVLIMSGNAMASPQDSKHPKMAQKWSALDFEKNQVIIFVWKYHCCSFPAVIKHKFTVFYSFNEKNDTPYWAKGSQ